MPRKILLIESDVALADRIAIALRDRGAEVRLAHDAGNAVDVARSERPDGIVLCAELPGGSGFVVCNKLRKDPDLRDVPLLLTSADASEETFEQHRKLKTRADAYLHKPFAISALVARLSPLTGLAEPEPGPPDDEDLLAFDAAFDSIAQVDEATGPIDHPVSSEEVDAAAALFSELPDLEDDAPPRAIAAAPVPSSAAGDAARAELHGARAELDELRAELARVRAELEDANAARTRVEQELAGGRERIRAALMAALAELDRS